MQAASRLRGFMPGFASPTVGNRSSDRLLPWLLLPVFVISILPIARLAIEGVFVDGVVVCGKKIILPVITENNKIISFQTGIVKKKNQDLAPYLLN